MYPLESCAPIVEIARTFVPMPAAEQQELLAPVYEETTDGRYDWFKSTQHFDSQVIGISLHFRQLDEPAYPRRSPKRLTDLELLGDDTNPVVQPDKQNSRCHSDRRIDETCGAS